MFSAALLLLCVAVGVWLARLAERRIASPPPAAANPAGPASPPPPPAVAAGVPPSLLTDEMVAAEFVSRMKAKAESERMQRTLDDIARITADQFRVVPQYQAPSAAPHPAMGQDAPKA